MLVGMAERNDSQELQDFRDFDKFTLRYEGSEPINRFPISYSNARQLLFSISLREDVAARYVNFPNEDILEANPAWFLEMLTCAAAYSLDYDYRNEFGQHAVPIIHPALPPWSRHRNFYKFYLDVTNEFLQQKTAEEMRLDFGMKIDAILDRYAKPEELMRDYDNFALRFEQIKTNALFNLHDTPL